MSEAIKIAPGRPPKRGLGDMVEAAVHPIAVALKFPCVDPATERLRPDSPCARRRDKLNQVGKAIGIG